MHGEHSFGMRKRAAVIVAAAVMAISAIAAAASAAPGQNPGQNGRGQNCPTGTFPCKQNSN